MDEYGRQATITITGKSWEENTLARADAVRSVAAATFTTEYSGDLVGESSCALVISYLDGDPADRSSFVGPYRGYEQVSGSLGGRTGTFVLAAQGEHSGGVARTEVSVVPGSGTGELAGIRGQGHYAADAMTYTMTLAYDFGDTA